MIVTNANQKSLKQIKEQAAQQREKEIRDQCEALAIERYGEATVIKLSNEYKGLWYLPVLSEDETTIEKLAIMKPIDRHILSYATTKMESDGLYIFLEACMNECFVEGDKEILNDDTYFLPAANKFNKIVESRKAFMVKR